jgi:hypothetical protein
MRKYTLSYPIGSGQLLHWLAVGPCPVVANTPDQPDFSQPPVELDKFNCGAGQEYWQVIHAGADGVLNVQVRENQPARLRWWVFCQVSITQPARAHLLVQANTPARTWWDGAELPDCAAQAEASPGGLRTSRTELDLAAGTHNLFIQFETPAAGGQRMAFAARLDGVPDGKLQLPTVTQQVERRLALEEAFACARLEKPILTHGDTLTVQWPAETPGGGKECLLRLQSPAEAIYAETMGAIRPGRAIRSITGLQLPPGELQAVLMPPFAVFYNEKVRARRSLSFQVAHSPFTEHAVEEDEDRRVRLVQAAAAQGGMLAELARAAMGRQDLQSKVIQAALQTVRDSIARQAVSAHWLPDLLHLLAFALRFPDAAFLVGVDEALGTGLQELAAVLGTGPDGGQTGSQAEALALAAIPLLVADARRTLADEPEPQTAGELRVVRILRQCAQFGFYDWNAKQDILIPTLVLLRDIAQSEQIYNLADVLIDRLLFGQALHTTRGVYGAPQRQLPAAAQFSARFHPASALGYLSWGAGGLDGELGAALHLAICEDYRMPEIIANIALNTGEPAWTLENSAQPGPEGELTGEVCRASYRTADYLLGSALDYRPGQPGDGERVWLASLSPDAQVYTVHPNLFTPLASPLASEGCLPRIAQWKDSLVALYNLPTDDPARYILAHFPLFAFDEQRLASGWAFARVGQAYLGLYASAGMALVERGELAFRALRAPGPQTAWLCQVGRQAEDGSFDDFCRRCLESGITVDGLMVDWLTPRGSQLSFGWHGSLGVSGEEQPLRGYPQLSSPYGSASIPAEQLDMIDQDLVLRLNFSDK